MEAYLDNAATTRASEAVTKLVEEVLLEDFGNPSSRHTKGIKAREYVEKSKRQIADILKCDMSEIVFTSGGTESNNMAIIGAALANKRSGNHIITTRIEHASVYQPFLFLRDFGFEVSFAPVDEYGRVDEKALLELVTDKTILVSVMMVNNEIGALEPVERLAKAVKEKKKDILFHVDAIQSFGKFEVVPKKLGADLLSVSGHKIHGPKGSGFLYVKKGTKIKPIIYGGGQEKGMRSGTENVPAIAGIGQASFDMYANLETNREHMYKLKESFISKLKEIDGVTVNGIPPEGVRATAPHVGSGSCAGIRSVGLLNS
ncbi:MAG: cysteine desulfurase, partial [Lachnospiraceae bacterium]|nr:cysteine desulfurase [Lachnospiraceae bacterium]